MARERTTANEPTKDIDPGGTRPARHETEKAGNKAEKKPAEQRVQSGDRNAMKGKPAS